jgi:hypothetical protein
MNVKNFIVGGIVGGLADFLLGWLFYGFLFKEQFAAGGTENMTLIFLGCLTFGFFVSLIFNQWAGISTAGSGLKAGALIGLFVGLHGNFFMNATIANPDYTLMGLDLIIMVAMSALVGALVGLVIGKFK